jgi:hypothetical protein
MVEIFRSKGNTYWGLIAPFLLEEKMLYEFNVNDWVMVKLTNVGIAELERENREWAEMYPQIKKFELPNTDVDGFSKWQLHYLMNRFGHLMTLGSPPPFETTMRLDITPHHQLLEE